MTAPASRDQGSGIRGQPGGCPAASLTPDSCPLAPDEEDLVGRLSGGDLDAAEQVFRTYEPYLRKVVRRQLPARLRAKFDSLDVVQSVWADVLEGFRDAAWHFPDARRLRAFLLVATRNRFLDRLRQHRTALKHERPLEALPPSEVPAPHEDRPSEVARANDLWDRLLGLCPAAHRPILELKRQGRPMAEIVARTGLHEDSIRRILRDLARRAALSPAHRAVPGKGP
jgi:RNA polymerase sigma-70 factor (ECF subfamily)